MSSGSPFGAWLKARRQDAGLSRNELAARIGCAAVTLVKIEVGERKPSPQIAALLAEEFGIPLDERPAFTRFAHADVDASRLRALLAAGEPAPWRALARPPTNLPAPSTAFIGREHTVDQASALLRSPGVRLLTLRGPPGIGKTRTALQVADRLLDQFADGVFFVPLAPIRDPALVVPALAGALDLGERGDRPLGRVVQEHLRHRQMLLLLDNLEQVLAAAPLIAELLEAGPQVKVLLTSRTLLGLSDGHDLLIPPLSLPDPAHLPPLNQLTRYEAVRLFVERAVAADPGFRVRAANARAVADICVQLDGVPLAIELAAARVRTLPVERIQAQLAHRLDLLVEGPIERPARQQTWRGAIEWSYDLLDTEARALFRRLGVFAGGCTLEAVERVCGRGAAHRGLPAVPDLLAMLVAQSLLREEQAGETRRFGMLETLREYARECLAVSGEASEWGRRHLDYYLELAEQDEHTWQGPQQGAWLERLEREHDNLRAALQWALDCHDADRALRLASTLWHFWYMRSYLGEGRRWLEAALRLAGSTATAARAQALAGLGVLTQRQSEYRQARTWLQQSLALWREVGDTRSIAVALNNLAGVTLEMGNDAEAAPLYQESLALFRALGDRPSLTVALMNLSMVKCAQGDYGAALALSQESLELARAAGGKDALARGLNSLGEIERLQGHVAAAVEYYDAALTLFRAMHDRRGTALVLSNLGPLAQRQGDLPGAEALLQESLRLYQEIGDRSGIAFCLGALAGVAGARGLYERAGRLFGATEALTAALGKPLDSSDQQEYDRHLAAVREQIDGDRLAQALAAGRAFTTDEAVGYALGA